MAVAKTLSCILIWKLEPRFCWLVFKRSCGQSFLSTKCEKKIFFFPYLNFKSKFKMWLGLIRRGGWWVLKDFVSFPKSDIFYDVYIEYLVSIIIFIISQRDTKKKYEGRGILTKKVFFLFYCHFNEDAMLFNATE